MTGALYLRPNVVVEPLVHEWYAWSHLIAPVPAAVYLAHHVKIARSFVEEPELHVAASKDAAMRGGPFLDLPASRVPDVKAWLDRTLDRRAQALATAAAVRELDELLATEARGASMEPLYARVPDALRGYVELVYDLAHQPSYRLLERLLYRSAHYDEGAQSIALSLLTSDDRPFVMSTPRLAEPGTVRATIPFAHPAVDALHAAKATPADPRALAEQLGLRASDAPALRALMTDEAPAPPAARYDGHGVRVRYFGHACVLVETRDVSILLDPALGYPYPSDLARYTLADLPSVIDYVLLTHDHQDHVQLETLLAIRARVRTVVVPRSNAGALADPSLRLALEQIGFRDVVDLDELGSIEVPGGRVVAVPFLGEHGDLAIATKSAYLVELAAERDRVPRRLLFAADSRNVEPRMYEHLRPVLGGDIDALFLGMECDGAPLSWVFGPRLARPLARRADVTRRFSGSDCAMAEDLVERFRPAHVYVYAMGQEPWLNHILAIAYTPSSRPIVESDQLVARARERGRTAERLFAKKELVL